MGAARGKTHTALAHCARTHTGIYSAYVSERIGNTRRGTAHACTDGSMSARTFGVRDRNRISSESNLIIKSSNLRIGIESESNLRIVESESESNLRIFESEWNLRIGIESHNLRISESQNQRIRIESSNRPIGIKSEPSQNRVETLTHASTCKQRTDGEDNSNAGH